MTRLSGLKTDGNCCTFHCFSKIWFIVYIAGHYTFTNFFHIFWSLPGMGSWSHNPEKNKWLEDEWVIFMLLAISYKHICFTMNTYHTAGYSVPQEKHETNINRAQNQTATTVLNFRRSLSGRVRSTPNMLPYKISQHRIWMWELIKDDDWGTQASSKSRGPATYLPTKQTVIRLSRHAPLTRGVPLTATPNPFTAVAVAIPR